MKPRSRCDEESDPHLFISAQSIGLILILGSILWVAAPASSAPETNPLQLTSSDVGWRLFSVFGLIAINAFFVATEFSMVAVRRSRIDQLVDEGDLAAKTVQTLQRNIDRLLSTTQLGITLSSLALGWVGEKTMAVLVAVALMQLPIQHELADLLAHTLAIPLAFGLVAYLQIVLGELFPKSIALLYSEEVARLLAPPSLAIAQSFKPFLWILNRSTRYLLRLAGIRYSGQNWHSRVTPEELQRIIATEGESTGLEAEARELLANAFEFGDVSVDEVMIPRTRLTAIPYDATFGMLVQEVAKSGHSRYPAIGESLDDVRGIIRFKELAEPLASGSLTLDSPIGPWVRPARFVPAYTLLSELLPMMQRSQQSMVVVVDEFGGTAGLVTMQDLVAELIGDVYEPQDAEAPSFQILDEQTFAVQAQMHLEEVNELLSLDLPLTDDYQTLGGFLIYQLQKIPAVGETWCDRNLELTVISASGPRLHQIQIRRQESISVTEPFEEPFTEPFGELSLTALENTLEEMEEMDVQPNGSPESLPSND
jgi:CBS domain containing-hemolysin-like protein